jgi:hypothetical protein
MFYPLWGTCLGYEFLSAYSSKLGLGVLGNFDLHKTSIPIKFTKNP